MARILIAAAAMAALAALHTGTPASAQQNPGLTVGAIYVGSVNDYGYNRSMKDGLDEMKHNIPGLKLIEAENVPETAESQRIMEGMIQQGAKLIFATSFGHQQFAFNLAKTHPDVVFEHAGGWMMAANFGNFFGATQSAWYPMGVAAGKMTKSNTLGFVVGVPIGYALGNVNAFEMGTRSVNPQAVTRVVVTGGWSDKAKEAAAAAALIDQGADVVTMHRGKSWRLLDRLSVDCRSASGAERLDHRTGIYLGSVHDGRCQERDRRHLQAGFRSAGTRPDDGDRAVWRGGAERCSRAGHCRSRQSRKGF
jgi:basic membrane protein A and related proteins